MCGHTGGPDAANDWLPNTNKSDRLVNLIVRRLFQCPFLSQLLLVFIYPSRSSDTKSSEFNGNQFSNSSVKPSPIWPVPPTFPRLFTGLSGCFVADRLQKPLGSFTFFLSHISPFHNSSPFMSPIPHRFIGYQFGELENNICSLGCSFLFFGLPWISKSVSVLPAILFRGLVLRTLKIKEFANDSSVTPTGKQLRNTAPCHVDLTPPPFCLRNFPIVIVIVLVPLSARMLWPLPRHRSLCVSLDHSLSSRWIRAHPSLSFLQLLSYSYPIPPSLHSFLLLSFFRNTCALLWMSMYTWCECVVMIPSSTTFSHQIEWRLFISNSFSAHLSCPFISLFVRSETETLAPAAIHSVASF